MKGSSYILSASFIELIRHPDYSIHARLNLIYYIFDWIKARFYFEKDEKIRKMIKEIENELIELRENYEDILDDKKAEYAAEKKAAFEKRFDIVRFKIVNLVENFEMLDTSMVSEFYMKGGKK